MPWAVTLLVSDCKTGAALAGATVSDGAGGGGYTDSYGQFIAVISDDFTGYNVLVAKAGYTSRTFSFARGQVGTPQKTCLDAAAVGPGPGPKPGPSLCFVVTAATGSADSAEVVRLRALRDRIAARSPVAARLIDAIYEEYWQFSPQVAHEIERSALLKQGALSLVVRPLSAWYHLAGQLALESDDTAAVSRAETEAVRSCPRYLGPSSVAAHLAAIARGDDLETSLPKGARALAGRLEAVRALPLVRWAIFEPLRLVWNAAANRLDMKVEVARWLAAAPVDVVSPPSSENLDTELRSLASLLAFDVGATAEVGGRLNRAWPEAGEALRRAKLTDA